MTLIVGLKAKGGIVFATDSRGTIGDPRGLTAINDNQDKLFRLGKCGLALSGASEMGRALLDEYRKAGVDAATQIDEMASLVASKSADLFKNWFRDIAPERRLGVVMILAGYRQSQGQPAEPMMYLLNSQSNFAPQLCSDTMMAGIPQYAVYLVHRYYSPDMTLAKAQALSEYLIVETASQDPKVGGPVRMAVVKPSGYRALTESQVISIHNKNDALNQRLKQFFVGGRR